MSPEAAPLRGRTLGPGRSPFFDRTVACPVCERQEAHRDLRVRTYLEEAWDSDRRVSRYRWLNPAYAGIHPPFYAVWHCPACHYADLKEAFQRPPAPPDPLAGLRPVFLRRLKEQDPVLLTLGGALGEPERTFASALAAHLLAVYIHELLPEGQQDLHKLGRLSLRTGWLYREFPQHFEGPPAARTEAAALLAHLAESWPAVPRTEPECLRRAVTAYQRYYEGAELPEEFALEVLDLIVDLHGRLGSWDQVRTGATVLARQTSEERLKFQQILSAGKDLTESGRGRARAKIESLTRLLVRAKARYDEAKRVVGGRT